MKEAILSVLEYFSFFCYPPSTDEIHKYLSINAKRHEVKFFLKQLVDNNILVEKYLDLHRYVLPENQSYFKVFAERKEISKEKLTEVASYMKICQVIPGVKFMGISGSTSMSNSKENSDVDLFIITQKNRLWTSRFWVVILAQVMGLRSIYSSARICLNLFFDEEELEIRRQKRNIYVAHEVVQLKVVLNKKNTYEIFMNKNHWITNYFPNVKLPYAGKYNSSGIQTFLGDMVESLFKKIQLRIIKNRLSEEAIYEKQLWLIQKDFEKSLDPYLQKKHIKKTK